MLVGVMAVPVHPGQRQGLVDVAGRDERVVGKKLFLFDFEFQVFVIVKSLDAHDALVVPPRLEAHGLGDLGVKAV